MLQFRLLNQGQLYPVPSAVKRLVKVSELIGLKVFRSEVCGDHTLSAITIPAVSSSRNISLLCFDIKALQLNSAMSNVVLCA